MDRMISKGELPHVVGKDELPFGKIAHKFEGYRFGDVGASFFLVESPPGEGWRARPPSPSATPP